MKLEPPPYIPARPYYVHTPRNRYVEAVKGAPFEIRKVGYPDFREVVGKDQHEENIFFKAHARCSELNDEHETMIASHGAGI